MYQSQVSLRKSLGFVPGHVVHGCLAPYPPYNHQLDCCSGALLPRGQPDTWRLKRGTDTCKHGSEQVVETKINLPL